MPDLTPQERRDIDEAMRAFPFLPSRITIPIGRWVIGRALRKRRRDDPAGCTDA